MVITFPRGSRQLAQSQFRIESEIVIRALQRMRQGSYPRAVYGVRPFAPRGRLVRNELIDKPREDDAY